MNIISFKKITILILLIFNLQICFGKIDLDFSHKRGYYSAPFSLIIEADDPNAIIRYTTNNTKPTANNGSIYNGPININSSTALRVFAYTNNDKSNTKTHSYIFLNDIVNSNYMYSYITDDAVYKPLMETSFKALPVISLISNNINGTNHIDTEIETSVEMFFPDGSRNGFMVHSGIQTWGGSPTNPKKHYRLEFKETYGASKLDYKVFKTDNYDNTVYGIPPTEKFNKLLLRGGSQDALNAEYGAENLAQYVRNRYFMDTQMEMGYPAPHGRFVHVFVNLEYVGQYHLMERPDEDWFESYYGGEETDYEVYKSGNYWDNLNLNLWDNLPNRVNLNSASAMQNTNNYIDLDQTAAYLNIMSYASGFDWSDSHNCLGGTHITPGNGGYKFIVWDMDFNFGNGGKWNPQGTNLNYFDAPLVDDGPVPDNLTNKVEFRYIMADHLECNCYNNGLLTPNVVDSLYMHRIKQVTTSLIAESARWGDYNFSYPQGHVQDAKWDVNGEFTDELNRIRTTWIPQRTNYMIDYYENNGLKSDLNAVAFNVYGGKVNQNFTLTLSNNNSNSNIYYTLDGSDPRAFGGDIANNAVLYTGPVNLPAGPVTVKARVRDNNHLNNNIKKWSAMCPRTFYVNQNYEDLVINEIHYNPKDSIFYNASIGAMDTVSGRNFEFVELKNTGDDLINLQDVSFAKGIAVTFDKNTIILPDSFLVVAEDAFWFEQKYGFAPGATYTGKLENSGEGLLLQAPCESFIDSLEYDDTLPWDTIPDDGIFSLALIDDLADNSVSTNWAKQTVSTTPGKTNRFCTPIEVSTTIFNVTCKGKDDGIIINEVSGGTAPFNFSWSNGAITENATNLVSGDYSLIITDKFDCSRSIDYTITEPAELLSNTSFTNQTYFQTNDGTASIAVSGGKMPYSYSWSNNETTASISNLAPGNYSVEVIDNNGCEINETITIAAIDCSTFDLQVNKTDETYFETDDGTATASVTNGATPYTYNWSNSATTQSISNLVPGNYSVEVEDNKGCVLNETVTIAAIDCAAFELQVNKTDETYLEADDGAASVSVVNGTAPYTYNWSNNATSASISNLTPGNYSVDVTDDKGCSSTSTFTIDAVDCSNFSIQISSSDETGYQLNDGTASVTVNGGTAPYNYNWSTGDTNSNITGLNPGSYLIDVVDSKGCALPGNATINPYVCQNILVDIDVFNESCFEEGDGMLIIRRVQNAITPYWVNWQGGITGTVNNNLTTGTYTLQIIDSKNCEFNNSYKIVAESNISASYTVSDLSATNANDGSINLSVVDGVAPYSYNWSNGQTNQNIFNLTEGVYDVTITDANDCVAKVDNINVGINSTNCLDNLVETNSPNIGTTDIQVADYIKTNGLVNGSNVVSYKAGNYIELMDNFEVKQGAEFEAIIEECN